jgi:plasmid stabilization system protein ParE
MKLRWTKRSQGDLVDIGRFIGRDKKAAARRWIERLRRSARAAANQPRAGRIVPEVGREDVREVLVGNYRIVYEIQKTEIRVLTVFEGHHRFPQSAIEPKDSREESER